MVMSVRITPLPLIFLLMIQGGFSGDWEVKYKSSHICALKNSSVIMNCEYEYPSKHKIKKVFWTKDHVKGVDPPDLFEDPKYSQRLQYLGDKQKICTVRLSHVTLKDSHKYYFRFITDKEKGRYTGYPGVTLSVTDLQVESPERVTEGDSVRLTCKSSCNLTDRATFIWYRNSQLVTTGIVRNQLDLGRVRREDAGRYSCAVHGHKHTSSAVQLNVTYPPKSASVSISPSGEIVSGDSVTLICSSDSNPPAEINWFKGGTFVGSGRIFNISKISSDDSGEYKCKSKNKHGEKYSDAVTLNVMYPPRNVSVLIAGSGEIVSGGSVTLICSSDSNPPALNFSWFKENETSAVGSGQSFSALQSGRFYCQAHNQHGSQRSDAVTVEDGFVSEQSTNLSAVIVIAVICAVIFLVCIIIFIRKRQCPEVSDLKQKQVQQPFSADRHHSDDGLYARVLPRRTRTDQIAGKTESTDSQKIGYATIQHTRNNEDTYENLRMDHPDPAVRSGVVKVIYSTVK